MIISLVMKYGKFKKNKLTHRVCFGRLFYYVERSVKCEVTF